MPIECCQTLEKQAFLSIMSLMPGRLDPMRGNAVTELPKAAEPSEPFLAKGFDLLPILGPTQDGAQTQEDDVEQLMALVAVDARVFDLAEMRLDGKRGRHHNSSMK